MLGSNRTFGLMLGFFLLGSATPAPAQTFGEAMGSLYLSADPDRRTPDLEAPLGTPFQFYILADIDYDEIDRPEWNAVNGITGWEMGIRLPSELVVTHFTTNPPNALYEYMGGNIQVAMGTCLPAVQSPLRLATYTALFLGPDLPTDLLIEPSSADLSSFIPPAAGWLEGEITGECTWPGGFTVRCKRAFLRTPPFRINCRTDCTVRTVAQSWGAVKARFGRDHR